MAAAEPGDTEVAEAPGSLSRQGLGLTGEGEQAPVRLLVDKDGRYVCMLCHKTFKTVSPGLWAGWACSLLGRCPEPRCSSPAGQHPQGPHGHPQQPQGP